MSNLTPTQIGSGHEGNLRDQVKAYFSRVKNGEMGALPAFGALVVLAILFGSLSPYFFTTLNIANPQHPTMQLRHFLDKVKPKPGALAPTVRARQ